MYFIPCQPTQGYDTVFWQKIPRVHEGDLIHDLSGDFLCLGEHIAFSALYPKTTKYQIVPTMTTRAFLSLSSIAIIHRLAYTYYASYKSVIELFHRKLPSGKKTLSAHWKIQQCCNLFPDLWSLTQAVQKTYGENDRGGTVAQLPSTVAILHGWLTVSQKAKIYTGIHRGEIHNLYATNRWLFFDRNNLTEIVIHNPHARSYSNQADPRFVIRDVAQKYANIYWASLVSVR